MTRPLTTSPRVLAEEACDANFFRRLCIKACQFLETNYQGISFTYVEHIELPAKLLDYFLRSNKSNINIQCALAEVASKGIEYSSLKKEER